jgi:anaerobic magnesium-protoporphyrin IX monomethyl ester cyclase
MRTLLTTLNAKYIHTNLAIRLLYSLNKDEHQGLEYKEYTIKEDRDALAKACAEFDVVAFSCYIWNITQTLDAARRIKQLRPDVKILLGGPEVSYDWQDVIEKEEVDYIITGEGEIPFKMFLDQYPAVTKIPNLAQKVNGQLVYFQENTTFEVANYENIMPYAFDNEADLNNKVLYIETSRGCPYKCEFCLASLDNKVRYLPDRHIKATLLHLMQHGKVIKFLDRTFNIKRDFTLDIFQFILDNHRPGNVFQFEITADILHPDIIRFIQEKVPQGLFRFEIGIQTVNQQANLEVSRKQNFDKTRNIIRSLEDYVEMHLDLIVGLPLDYWEDIRFSFEEVFKLYPPELQLGFLKFLKGTPVRHKYEQHQFVFDSEPPYQIIESKYLSREQLHLIEVLEHALEIYWNKKRAVHTLKYANAHLGIFDFLMGLGLYFGRFRAYHQYTQQDIFDLLLGFVEEQYPNDPVLKQLLTIDYFLQHKVKPRDQYYPELPVVEKNKLAKQYQLNLHKYRFAMLPLSFDYRAMLQHQNLIQQESLLVIQYTGTSAPQILDLDVAVPTY